MFDVIAKPTCVRDRDAVTKAAAFAILAVEIEKARADGGDSLHNLVRVFLSHLQAHGVELRVRRAVRS